MLSMLSNPTKGPGITNPSLWLGLKKQICCFCVKECEN